MRTPDEIQVEIDHLEDQIKKKKSSILKKEARIEELRNLKSKAIYAEELENGVEVNVVSITGEWPEFLVTTDEGFKWWSRDKGQELGPTRITRRFYAQIKDAYEKKQEEG